ncbi:hypothetical protein N2384_05700 [Bacillus paralicheniformis]|nr:hypothetical protein [Bacillus paralicheniformis]UWS62553.1 hypothetical protein N2384_05700 [Bacillus paralicheniformis]
MKRIVTPETLPDLHDFADDFFPLLIPYEEAHVISLVEFFIGDTDPCPTR